MIRDVLGVIAGIVVGNILFVIFQAISHAVSPAPEGLDVEKFTSLKEIIDSMPVYAWLILILGYVAGTFAGGFVVGKIAESKVIVFPSILAVFFMVGWLINIMMIPHPLWVVAVVFLVFIPSALAGYKYSLGNVSDSD